MSSVWSSFVYLYYQIRSQLNHLVGRLLPTLKPERVDLSGKTVVVLGANAGIGLEVAQNLALMGAHVVLVCRSQAKAAAAISDILNNANGAVQPENLEYMHLDCVDLESVSKFVQEWGDRPLDVLVNNAGMTTSIYKKNPQGFELTYAVNILSHVLLTLSLLPHMSHNARIINVSSIGQYGVQQQFDPDDLDKSSILEGKLRLKLGDSLPMSQTMDLYGRTKLLQVFLTLEMQARLDRSSVYAKKNISVHSYHPGSASYILISALEHLELGKYTGLVKTSIWRREHSMNTSFRDLIIRVVESIGVSPSQGAATAVFLATAEEPLQWKGLYWERMSLWGHNILANDEQVRGRVFDQMVLECKLPESLQI